MTYKGVVVGGIPKNLNNEDIKAFFKDAGDILEIETYADTAGGDFVNVHIVFNKPAPEVVKSDGSAESSSSSSTETPAPSGPTVIQKVLAFNDKEIQDSKLRIVECPYVVTQYEAKQKTSTYDNFKKSAQRGFTSIKDAAVSIDFKKSAQRKFSSIKDTAVSIDFRKSAQRGFSSVKDTTISIDNKLHFSSSVSSAAHATSQAFSSLISAIKNLLKRRKERKEKENEKAKVKEEKEEVKEEKEEVKEQKEEVKEEKEEVKEEPPAAIVEDK